MKKPPLLAPDATRVALEPGLYVFKTLSDAHLQVVHGGVETTTRTTQDRDIVPEPGPRVTVASP